MCYIQGDKGQDWGLQYRAENSFKNGNPTNEKKKLN